VETIFRKGNITGEHDVQKKKNNEKGFYTGSYDMDPSHCDCRGPKKYLSGPNATGIET
jgi:hypothetical protein